MRKHLTRSECLPTAATPAELLPLYQRWLPTQIVVLLLRETKQTFYQRLLPPMMVLWGFIYQRLNPDHTCDAAWSYLSTTAIRQQFGLKAPPPATVSESTSAYCQARQRLPVALAHGVLGATAQAVQQEMGEQGRWRGYLVNLFDGSTLRLQASPELTEHYGVVSNQHGASHWPIMRLVVGFDLSSGVANAVAEGPYRSSEQELAGPVIRGFGAGYLHVGDGNFGVYRLVQASHGSGSDALLRLSVTRARYLAGGSLHSGMDSAVVWSPSPHDQCEKDMPAPPIAGRLIYVRLTRNGFRPIDLYLFTTLTDREQFPMLDLVALYGERWNVELDLRHVKTTLQMEQLDGRSVDIVGKELILGLVAYNLLRGLMGAAALLAQRSPLELSLAMCWRRTLDHCRTLPREATPAEIAGMLAVLLGRLGRCLLPKRKRERFEPRAVWGRPSVYPKIKGSREQARREWMDKLKNKS
jgi:putative transposase